MKREEIEIGKLVDVYVPVPESPKDMERVGTGRIFAFSNNLAIPLVMVKMISDKYGDEFRSVEMLDIIPHTDTNNETFRIIEG